MLPAEPNDPAAVAELEAELDTPGFGPEETLLDMTTLAAVTGNPRQPTTFVVRVPTRLTRMVTYHWNGGAGTTPGQLGVRQVETGRARTWSAEGVKQPGGLAPGNVWTPADGKPPFLFWRGSLGPSEMLLPGTYAVIDSSPETWSTNAEVGDRGIAHVFGAPAAGAGGAAVAR